MLAELEGMTLHCPYLFYVKRDAHCLVLLRIGLDRHLDGSLCLVFLGMGTSEKSLPSLCIEYIYNGAL